MILNSLSTRGMRAL